MFVARFRVADRRDDGELSTALEHVLDPYQVADQSGEWHDEYALMVASTVSNTFESRAEQPVYSCPRTGRIVVWWGRLDNRAELLAQLAPPSAADAAVATDQMLVAAAFDRWGHDCARHLLGDFSFAVYDPREPSIFVARDPLGVKPIYYHASSSVFVVATTAAVFRHLPDVSLSLSQEWLAKYLLGSSISHVETPWPEVRKLPGGHTQTASVRDNRVHVTDPRQYFSFHDDQPEARKRSDHWVDAYRSVLEESVRCRIRTDFSLGVETSGGIDSSTCLGFAAHLWERPLDQIHTYGFILEKDEPDFIYDTGRMHRIKNEHMYVAGEFEQASDLRERTFSVLGYPQEHGSGSTHDVFYTHCEQHDVRTLLSGFGGDEGVTNPAPQLYEELIASRRLLALLANMHGPTLQRPARAAKYMMHRLRKPAWHLFRVAEQRWQHHTVRPEIVSRYGLEEDFLNRHRYLDGYKRINDWALNEGLGNAFVPTRLENCTLLARSRGVDYRWPLLDVRLIQQWLSTPAIEKRGPDMGRYLHRRALDGIVPKKVAWKPSKHMGGLIHQREVGVRSVGIPELIADLHPALTDIVDGTKFVERAEGLDGQPPSPGDHLVFVARREHTRLRTLDSWLKTNHS